MLNEGLYVAVVLLDNSAAFDTVDHKMLLQRLENQFNIKGNALKLLESYLNGRTFSVVINDEVSEPTALCHGVPQGSILGPLFYLLYTKDLERIVESYGLKVSLYADDIQIYCGFKAECATTVVKNLENCIQGIQNWMQANFLKLNPTKTMVKLLKPVKHSLNTDIDSFHLKIGNAIIQSSTSVKVLGVTLGAKLNFQEFISNKIRVCNFHLRNLRNVKSCLPQDSRILLVNNLILSNLDYCNSILACLPECQIYPLQKILNKAVRFIFNLRYFEHISPFLYKLHFLPINFRIRFKLCLIAYKIIIGSAPMYLSNAFELFKPNTTINLRPGAGRDELMLKISLQERKKTTLYSKIIIEWNNLPLEIRKINNIIHFKTQLKTHFFRKAFAEFL
jgi:hypothetical protein